MAPSLLTGLMLLLCSMSNTSPSEDHNQASFCPDPAACNCLTLLNEFEIECPEFDPKVIVKLRPSKYVRIDCLSIRDNVYENLPVMKLGDMPRVRFQHCPLPLGEISFMKILNQLGINKTTTLMFQTLGVYLENTLVREHLSGFTELRRLALSGNGITELPEDFFDDVSNIVDLDLRSNELLVTAKIFQNLKNLEILELGDNSLSTLEPGTFKHQQKLISLNLWENNLQHLTKEVFEGVSSLLELDLSANLFETLLPDVFSYLVNLTTINLSSNQFFKLPEGLFENNKNLVQLKMVENRNNLDTLPSGFLSGKPDLEIVHIMCGLKKVPGNLIANSGRITHLSLASNKLVTLPVELFANQSQLLDLDLSDNNLIELEDRLFESMSELIVLRLSYNNLTIISNKLLRGLRRVQEIYLDNNHLKIIQHSAFSMTKQIYNLQLQNNQLSFLSEGEEGVQHEFYLHLGTLSPFQYLENLKTLNLRKNSVTAILSDWIYNNNNLEELDLSHNKLSYLMFSDLLFFSDSIKIDLTHNEIKNLDFREFRATIAKDSTRTATVFLDFNPVSCDCRLFDFIEYIHLQSHKNIIVQANQLKCASPEPMVGELVTRIHLKDIVCSLDSPNSPIKHCPAHCDCFVRPYDEVMGVNCSNAHLKVVPIIPDPKHFGLTFTELYIENNHLTELPDLGREGYSSVNVIRARNNSMRVIKRDNLPPKLKMLDVSHNQINWLNDSVYARLNKTTELQQISLGQNPWICDCSALGLFGFVKLHAAKILDLKELRCLDGRLFVDVGELCPEDKTIVVALSVTLALLGLFIGVLAALYYKYQQEINVWMYAHNLCAWFVTEQELDRDKKYDAFMSYSHKDVDFVTEHIVPELENGTPSFKLCLHERDWVAGEFITESIARSVEDSRRTIVILSPNFLESIWGQMEFQVAHKYALTEGRVRVIVIICGDIGDIENLDPVLKTYLKTNTYIKWGDPWFWEKLRYAMPHPNGYKDRGLVKTTLKSSVDDKLELIEPPRIARN